MKLFAIRDIVAGAIVGPPFPGRTPAVACREFYQLLGDKRTQLSQHPADYELVQLCEYADATDETYTAGDIQHVPSHPEVIATGKTWQDIQSAQAAGADQ